MSRCPYLSEYLGERSNQSGRHSNIKFLLRSDHEAYLVTLGNSKLIDEKWFSFDRVSMKKLKDRKPKFKTSEYSLGGEEGLAIPIPEQGFKAVFFDIKTREIKFEKDLKSIHVDLGNNNYEKNNQSTFHGIDARNLGVYVIGYLEFREDTEKDITVNWGHWSKVKVKIDDNIIVGSCIVKYPFTKGKHLVEVLYKNNLNPMNWAKFYLKIQNPDVNFSRKEISKELSNLSLKKPKIWYASAYSSTDGYQNFKITLKRSDEPVVLFVSTYEILHFDVYGADQANLKAVILSSYSPSTLKFHSRDSDIPVYRMMGQHNLPIVSKMVPKVKKHGDMYVAENRIKDLLEQILAISGGKRLDAYSMVCDSSELTVPEKVLSDSSYGELEKDIQIAWELANIIAE